MFATGGNLRAVLCCFSSVCVCDRCKHKQTKKNAIAGKKINARWTQTQTDEKECNCRKKDQCPLDEKCLAQNVVYQATVSTQSSSETYVGLATNFKERYRNHTASFRHQSKRNDTELSKHIWALKDNNKPFDIKWRIIKQCRPYSNVSNKCNLCLFEKFIIICRKNLCSLNKRNELASSCPHRNRYLLKNIL